MATQSLSEIEEKILEVRSSPLRTEGIDILQMNLGYRCNMSCKHCHIEAGPGRTELMNRDVIDASLAFASDNGIMTLDLTGGAPEMNYHFRYLVAEAKKMGSRVIVRTNLTVIFEKGMEDLPDFYSENNIEVTASLPHYTEMSVDRVRGPGTFSKSMEALKRLNSLGYGRREGKTLNLVYNPPGAFMSASQTEMEEQYRKELGAAYGIVFDRLYAFANMPVGRFREFLIRSNNYRKYMDQIKYAFNPCTLDNLMCRYLISVGWDGSLYDCDFNQMLGLAVDADCSSDIRDCDYSSLAGRRIVMGEHCFVCTAGQGST